MSNIAAPLKILLIAEPERVDHYSYLAADQDASYSLLWFEKASQSDIDLEKLPLRFHENLFWKDYRSPAALLHKVRPDRIVFQEIIDLRQIALIVAARAARIPTFYMDHGAAADKDTSIERWKEITFTGSKLPYLIRRIRTSFFDVLASKLFYYSQLRGFTSFGSLWKYWILPFKLMMKGPNETLAHTLFRERVPARSICFNETNFLALQVYTGITEDDAVLTGVPYFDCYYSSTPVEKDYLVFIEHPYLEQNILGWTDTFHRQLAQQLYQFARSRGIKMYVKLHPKSDMANWTRYGFDPQFVEVIQAGDYTQLYLGSKLILGYSSSLLTGFLCARKNVVLLGWHPTPGIFGIDFSESGLCHKSTDLTDLETKYDYWVSHNLCHQSAQYDAFLKRSNYPFDGKATQRVIEAIHQA